METMTNQGRNDKWEAARSQFNDVEIDIADCIHAIEYLAKNINDQALNDDLQNIGGKAEPLDRKRVVRDSYAISYLMRCITLNLQEQYNLISTTCNEYDNAISKGES
ncbi:hypothetical protein [Desulfonatronum parangueonense]